MSYFEGNFKMLQFELVISQPSEKCNLKSRRKLLEKNHDSVVFLRAASRWHCELLGLEKDKLAAALHRGTPTYQQGCPQPSHVYPQIKQLTLSKTEISK